MGNLWLHLGCYYLVWFTCILSASYGFYWLGLFTSIIISLLQYCWQNYLTPLPHISTLVVIITITGFVIDSLLASFNLISFSANPWMANLSPPWMIGLWINFSLLLYIKLRNYFLSYKLLGSLSLIGFPLAYGAGESLGAATLTHGYTSLLVIAISWGLIFPTVLYWYAKLLGSKLVC